MSSMKSVFAICFVFILISLIIYKPHVISSPLRHISRDKMLKQKIKAAIQKWDEYKLKFKKEYAEGEENDHLNAFVKNIIRIEEHNLKYIAGEASFKMEIYQFTDMLDCINEFQLISSRSNNFGQKFRAPLNVEIPESVDWRKHGFVTAVKDQGHCGSCWAFSSTGALEGQIARKTGKLVSLSEQNLIDCTYHELSHEEDTLNHGCQGGFMNNSFQYVKENGGIDTEASYPYVGEKSDFTCKFDKKNIGATDTGYAMIPYGDENMLKIAVATQGPIAIAIHTSFSFKHYKQGVYYNENCSSDELGHAVLIVGYGTDLTGGDYWIVKNSWGSGWGEDGYIKMARNRDNNCGIASYALYPLV